MKIYDVSVPVHPAMHVFPGDPVVQTQAVKSFEQGEAYQLHLVTMGNHAGTHVDAPSHFIPGGATITDLPLELMNGRTRVIEIHHPEKIDVPELKRLVLVDDFRVLFKTRNSLIWANHDTFQQDFIYLTERAAHYLVENGIKLVGVDYLSIDQFGNNGHPVHHLLLKNNVVIVEGLNLAEVEEGEYDMSCLPLALQNLDAAPARVILTR